MRQLTLATAGFDKHHKTTRRAAFLVEMDRVVPCAELCSVVAPFYPKPGNGRPSVGLERCCGCISCSTGSTCPTLRRRRRYMIRCRCGGLSASTSAAKRCR